MQVALFPALGGAIVVVIRSSGLARTGHALHGASALTAIELACKPIARSLVLVHIVRPLGTLALVLGEPPLRPVESHLVDKDGHSLNAHCTNGAVFGSGMYFFVELSTS